MLKNGFKRSGADFFRVKVNFSTNKMKISEKNGYFSELDDVLEASITDLPSDAFLTKYLVSVPIILLAFAMLFGKLNFCKKQIMADSVYLVCYENALIQELLFRW